MQIYSGRRNDALFLAVEEILVFFCCCSTQSRYRN